MPLSVIFIYGTNIIKTSVLNCLDDAPYHFTKGACHKSVIQGHTSILEKDSNQNGTHLHLTDNNICHNIRSLAHTLSPGLQKVHMEALCPIVSGNAVIMSACLDNMNVRSMTP